MNDTITVTESPVSLPAGSNFITLALVLRTIGIIFAYYVVRFFYKLYTVRSTVKRHAREYGLVSSKNLGF